VKRAIFFDRDGTLIEDVPHLADPARVRLLPGAAAALRALRARGFGCVLVSNQSAIGRGLLRLAELARVQRRLDELLAAEGAVLDGWYFSAEIMKGHDRYVVEHPDRKPGPGMLLRAAREHDIALGQSWMVGDAISDTLAGRHARCQRTVLVRGGLSEAAEETHPSVDHVVSDLGGVVGLVDAARAAQP